MAAGGEVEKLSKQRLALTTTENGSQLCYLKSVQTLKTYCAF